jgi:hypothetical protein
MTELAFTIEDAVKFSGLARTRLYILLADGKLEARKAGRRTLIMGDSLRHYLESLPPAEFGANKAA